jgi:hypothetical protein
MSSNPFLTTLNEFIDISDEIIANSNGSMVIMIDADLLNQSVLLWQWVAQQF